MLMLYVDVLLELLLFEGELVVVAVLLVLLFGNVDVLLLVWVFDVSVLLVLLFEGEWFLLLRVVVFISFPWAGLPGPCCDAAFASSTAVAFLLPSFSLCVACLTLSWCSCSPLLPFSPQNCWSAAPFFVGFVWLVG